MSYNFYDIKESYQYDLLQSLSDLENPSFTDSFFPPPPKEEENYVTELMDLISPSFNYMGSDKKDAFYDFGADLISQDTSFEELESQVESQEELPYINEIQDYITLSHKKVEFFGLPPLSTDDLSYFPVQLKLNAPISPNDSMDALSLLIGSPNNNPTQQDGSSSPHMDCTSQPSSPFHSPTQNPVNIKTEQFDQSTFLDSFFAQNNQTHIVPSTDDIVNVITVENESKYNIMPQINTCGNVDKTDYFKSEMRKEQLNRYRMKKMKRKYNRPVSASRSESAKSRLRGQNGRFIKKTPNSKNTQTPFNNTQNNPCPPFIYNPLLNTPMPLINPMQNSYHTMIIPQ